MLVLRALEDVVDDARHLVAEHGGAVDVDADLRVERQALPVRRAEAGVLACGLVLDDPDLARVRVADERVDLAADEVAVELVAKLQFHAEDLPGRGVPAVVIRGEQRGEPHLVVIGEIGDGDGAEHGRQPSLEIAALPREQPLLDASVRHRAELGVW
jgi:hypothetical protein